jgi:hypothetical protein
MDAVLQPHVLSLAAGVLCAVVVLIATARAVAAQLAGPGRRRPSALRRGSGWALALGTVLLVAALALRVWVQIA